MIAILAPVTAAAASLDATTSQAWENYVQAAALRAAQHSRPETFLWVDEAPDQLARVRKGEIVVSPAGRRTPTKVPAGLVHDWTGAIFIPHVTLRDVLHVVSDYPQYKDFYQPAVVSSRTIEAADVQARFSMVLVYNSLFLKAALDTDYESRYISLNDRSGYTLTRATRIQEIADYGAPQQHVLHEGDGSGVIRGLFSIARYTERDGGVYVELELIGLSRDIPGSLRWLVEPIVRRVARATLQTSLEQTKEAVRARVQLTSQSASSGAGN